MIHPQTVHLLSGGIDSTVLLYELIARKHRVCCLLVSYGQTHQKELDLAMWHCDKLGVNYFKQQVNLKGSSLTGDGDSFIVPMRNAAFLSLAVNLAVRAKATQVTIGCNMDDGVNFPDCRLEFIHAFDKAVKASGYQIDILAPNINFTKKQIVQLGREHDVELAKTWSCYLGGKEPCGQCLACQKREEAGA